MHHLNLSKEHFTIHTQEEDGYPIEVYQHNDSDLKFFVQYNKNNDNVLEFKVVDGDRVLGTGYQNELDKERWVNDFIFGGHFNVWLSSKKLKIH